jgi:hypothetical protein
LNQSIRSLISIEICSRSSAQKCLCDALIAVLTGVSFETNSDGMLEKGVHKKTENIFFFQQVILRSFQTAFSKIKK